MPQVYDDGDEFQAALAWWALAVYGHPRPHVLQVRGSSPWGYYGARWDYNVARWEHKVR